MIGNHEITYRPLPKQNQFLTSNSHFAAFIAGIGSGKTTTGTHRGVRAAFGQVGTTPITTPNTGMVCAPTYDMINLIVVPSYYEVLGGTLDEGGLIADYNKSEKVMTLVNGSKIVFRSTDNPERLRGPNLSWIHMDEAALMSQNVWQILFGRVRAEGAFGHIWLTSTPAGRNWIYQKWVQDRRDSYQLVQMHTFENIFLHPDFLLELADEYDGDYAKQELGGVFIGYKGLIYPEFNPDRHMFAGEIDTARYKYFVGGVDWGFASPGVILIGGVDADGRVDIVYEDYTKRRAIEDWAQVAYQLHRTYNIQTFYCDPSKPDYIAQFVEAGVNAVPADNTVESGIQDVRSLLTKRDDTGTPYLRLHNVTPWLQNEFTQYQWLTRNVQGVGEVNLDVPKKAKDHTMDSLRYLVRGIKSGSDFFDYDVDVRKYA
ncbi:MAG: phage terminase large subunit [Anaerolineae bacterium]